MAPQSDGRSVHRHRDRQASAAALASALAKIDADEIDNIPAEQNPATAHLFIINPLCGARMDNLFSTHPATENRIAALEQLVAQLGLAPSGRFPQLAPSASGLWGRRGPWSLLGYQRTYHKPEPMPALLPKADMSAR